MPEIVTYHDLDAWRQSMDLVEQCYRLTRSFPQDERYGLTSQLRRAACSIPSNIAEGYCRRSTAAYANHVSIALGSHGEVETCAEIGFRLGLLSQVEKASLDQATASVGRLLSGLHRSLEEKMARELPRKR